MAADNFFGQPYPETTPIQDLVGYLGPIAPNGGAIWQQPPRDVPAGTPRTSTQGPPGSGGTMGKVPNPAQRAALEKEAIIKQSDRQIQLSKQRAAIQAQQAQSDAMLARQEAQTNHIAEAERFRLDQLHEFAAADQAAQQEQHKLEIQKAKQQTDREKAKAQGAKLQTEKAAAPTDAVAQGLTGVENTGNLATPGAFARGTYDTGGGQASEAIQTAMQASGNTVDVGGSQFTAPSQITSREFSYKPEYMPTSTGFMGVTSPSYSTRSTDNVLTAGDVANLRQRQSENLAERVDSLRRDIPNANPGQLVDYAQALQSGDPAEITRASAGMPKGLQTKAAELAISTQFKNNERADLELQMMKQYVGQVGADAGFNPLSMMGLSGGQTGGFDIGRRLAGLPGATTKTAGGIQFGQWGNLASAAWGKGTQDDPNFFAVNGLQLQALQGSNGQLLLEMDADGKPTYVDTGRYVALFKGMVGARTAREQAAYKQKLLETGMFMETPGPNGALRLEVDPTSVNSINGHALLNYVDAEAQISAAARAAGREWSGPIRPNAALAERAGLYFESHKPPPKPSRPNVLYPFLPSAE